MSEPPQGSNTAAEQEARELLSHGASAGTARQQLATLKGLDALHPKLRKLLSTTKTRSARLHRWHFLSRQEPRAQNLHRGPTVRPPSLIRKRKTRMNAWLQRGEASAHRMLSRNNYRARTSWYKVH